MYHASSFHGLARDAGARCAAWKTKASVVAAGSPFPGSKAWSAKPAGFLFVMGDFIATHALRARRPFLFAPRLSIAASSRRRFIALSTRVENPWRFRLDFSYAM